jgi:hypothetical protein
MRSHKMDLEAAFMAALAKFKKTAREQGLGVTVVFDCIAGADGQRFFSTNFREAIANRRNASAAAE